MGPRNTKIILSATPLVAMAIILAGCAGGSGTNSGAVQGWTANQRSDWYTATQGSRLMPLSWFNALEQPGSQAAFADQTYLGSFGYIPSDASRAEPLPVGFAIDQQDDSNFKVSGLQWYAGQKRGKKTAEKWIGLNCAACHTGEVAYEGKSIRIDGGPALGDYQGFVEAVDLALHETQADGARFERFAAKVLAGKDTPANRASLKAKLGELIVWEDRVERINDTPLRSGFARIDAFGHIYNKVALFNGADPQVLNPSDAPVSYPFLWDISRQTQVQWNGVVKNQKITIAGNEFDYGALGRNAGEVIGVFGEVSVVPASGTSGIIKGYQSSVDAANLIKLEAILTKLEPPKWPAVMPTVDSAMVAKGEQLFDAKCASCHLPRDTWVTGQPIERMIPLKVMGKDLTDIWMACNAATYFAFTGNLKGTKSGFVSGPPLTGQETLVTQLQTTVKGALIAKKGPIIAEAAATFLGIDGRPKVIGGSDDDMTAAEKREARREGCKTKDSPILAYKARPLDGVWATAPYLHNGSVPTLWHLLLPAKDRPKSFWLGSRDYDAKLVGYVWDKKPVGPSFEFRAADSRGFAIDGNSNAGHEYGAAGFSDADRWALVEYMKTL
jgi:hypothetical protein